MDQVTQAIRDLRGQLGCSQQAFAVRLGLSLSAIATYEAGRIPKPSVLASLAQLASTTRHFGHFKIFGRKYVESTGLDLSFQDASLQESAIRMAKHLRSGLGIKINPNVMALVLTSYINAVFIYGRESGQSSPAELFLLEVVFSDPDALKGFTNSDAQTDVVSRPLPSHVA